MLILLLLSIKKIASYIKKLRKNRNINNNNNNIEIIDKPLITFTGGGQLGWYYQGICACLQDNYNLNNCRFAGISVGATAASSLAHELPTDISMIFGFRLIKLIKDRKLKGFFFSTKEFVDIAKSVSDDFGIDDNYIKAMSEKKKDCLYYGVTNVLKIQHELLTNFQSQNESFVGMSCSMRIFPFFFAPGYYKNKILIDGGFSRFWSIPNNVNKNKIIYITCLSSNIIKADIQPNINKYPYKTFKLKDAILMPSNEFIFEQFKRGYNDAFKNRFKLIEKGIKLKNNLTHFQYKLNKHLKKLKKYSDIVFNDKKNVNNYKNIIGLKNMYKPKFI